MALDPQARAFLNQLSAMGAPPINELTVDEARQSLAAMTEMQGAPEVVAKVEDRIVPSPEGGIPVRIYSPAGTGLRPILVYFHGGGWVVGSIETHDPLCRAIANATGCVVLSVDYRLAPEHKYPAAADDAYRATVWASEAAASFGGDASRLAVGGDSAGGNLAAVVAQMARDRHKPALKFQLLIYPVTDAACDTPSYSENGDGYMLTRDAMEWFWNHYIGNDADRIKPYASPLRANSLEGLPQALVLTAEYDPLRDEGEFYAHRMQAAGVPVELKRYGGMIHGFLGMGAMIDQSKTALRHAAAVLRTALSA